MFIEKLIEVLVNAWERIAPFVIVHVYEKGVILRFGRYVRTVEPGIRWKIPYVEESIEVNTVLTTMRLPPQSLTTKDMRDVVVAAIVKYRIADPKPYITEVWDQVDVLADVAMGEIARQVKLLEAEELFLDPPEGKIAAAVRRRVKDYGFEIEAVTFTDLARARSLRLVAAAGKDLAN